MKSAAIITDSEILSQSIASYIGVMYGDTIECFPIAYQKRSHQLTGRLYQKTDIFILGLFRAYSDGLRAEGLFAAEKIAKSWRRIVIIGEWTIAETLGSPIYWDMGSTRSFQQFLEDSINNQINFQSEIIRLKRFFHAYCFKPRHGQQSI